MLQNLRKLDRKEIVNRFNEHFVDVRPNLAKRITANILTLPSKIT